MFGYIIFSADGEEILNIEGDFLKIFEDRTDIFKEKILVAVVPKSMLIVRGEFEQ